MVVVVERVTLAIDQLQTRQMLCVVCEQFDHVQKCQGQYIPMLAVQKQRDTRRQK